MGFIDMYCLVHRKNTVIHHENGKKLVFSETLRSRRRMNQIECSSLNLAQWQCTESEEVNSNRQYQLNYNHEDPKTTELWWRKAQTSGIRYMKWGEG